MLWLDSMKMKGINLQTQALLTIADTDSIMNILHSIDNRSYSNVATTPHANSNNINTLTNIGGVNTSSNNNLSSNNSGNSLASLALAHMNTTDQNKNNSSQPMQRKSLVMQSNNLPTLLANKLSTSQSNTSLAATVMNTTKQQLGNSRLYSFIDAADPTKSFLDLSLILDEPVEEVI